jgi:putative ABC transport system permease protein
MSYALNAIWYERQRYLPAIFAVAFSYLLISVQGGLSIGLLSMISIPIDQSPADLWVGYPGVRSVDLGRPIPSRWSARVAAEPEVERVEPCIIGFSLWTAITRRGEQPATPEVVTIVGGRLNPDSLGAVSELRARPELMTLLAEPGTVAIDETELTRLGVQKIGDQAEVLGRRVRLAGVVHGYKSLGGPYVLCSLETARALLKDPGSGVTYLIAKLNDPSAATAVAARLNRYPTMSAFTATEFSYRSRMHWLLTTKAGIAIGFTATLGLFVGAVVTSQTLYAATTASQREFATLRAMGIPAIRLKWTVMEQSFWVGLFGILVAIPIAAGIAEVAEQVGIQVRLHPLVLLTAAGVTLVMALVSGLAALRSLQGVDPAHNIR